MSIQRLGILLAAALALPQFATPRVVLGDGACCHGDGTCEVLPKAYCDGPCDRYLGDGTDCTNRCIVEVPGPCCLPDGSCYVTNPCLCRAAGGDPQSPFQTCATVDCTPKGACCRIDGSCDVTTEDDCQGPCERYRGDGTNCSGLILCPIQVPAPCCFNDGSCQMLMPCVCRDQGGDPHSPFQTCASVDCPPKGACCRIDGSCDVTTEDDCQGPCEIYGGDGTECDHLHLCPIQLSAPCCFDDGTCEFIKPCLCRDQGGDPHSPFETCATVDCTPTGACCRLDGSCDVTTEDDCQGPCERYRGDGTNCSGLILCPIQVPAPCCFNDGSCLMLMPCVCRDQGGDPHSPFQTCASVDCPPKGACCRIDGSCDVTTEDDCQGPCEIYGGDGTECDHLHLCPIQLSAPCCFDDGTCEFIKPCLCRDQGGDPHSPFETCATVDCTPTGACCRLDGSCDVTTEDDCQGPCETYLGDGTDCSSTFCPLQLPRPCCLSDGTCQVIQPCECVALGGETQPGPQTCEGVDCPPKGACCRIDGSCDVTTEDDCQGPCESYGGDGTACDGMHLCPIQLSAPCCFGDGTCQILKPCLCLDQGGDPQSPFDTCATANCP